MESIKIHFEDTVKILQSSRRDLYDLAKLTKFDPFSFYQNADLRGLDFEGQNLTGLNFDGTDLRGCKFDQVIHDLGAFNNSILDDDAKIIKDEYDTSLDEYVLLENKLRYLYVSCEFRDGFIDTCLRLFGVTYRDFAARCGITPFTLRKARRAYKVLRLTADTIVRELLAILAETKSTSLFGSREVDWMRQPHVSFARSFTYGDFTNITKQEVQNYDITIFNIDHQLSLV